MPRVFIIAAATASAAVLLFIVWRSRPPAVHETGVVEPKVAVAPPAAEVSSAALERKPASDGRARDFEDKFEDEREESRGEEIAVAERLTGVEPLRREVAGDEEAEEGSRAFDRQALLEAIDGPGADNVRVAELAGQLRGVDLQNADLKLMEMRGVEAPEINLSGANLQGADLSQASMPGSRLNGADLTGAILDGIDLRGAHLEGVTLKASARGADLRGVRMNGAALEGADLTGADMRSAYLIDSSMGAIMRQADLRYADMRRADFLGADLTGADLDSANLLDVGNLTCEQLQRARNWARSLRPSDLACGEPIPQPTKAEAQN